MRPQVSTEAAASSPDANPASAAPAAPVEAVNQTAARHAATETPKETAADTRPADLATNDSSRHFESTLMKSAGASVRPQGAQPTTTHPLHAASVRSQVIRQVAAQARPTGGTESVTLQLNPEHLGQVEIQFSGRDDQLQVVITASGQDAERALREGVRELADGIVERSGRWQQVEVRVELKDSGERRQERGSSDGDSSRDQGRQPRRRRWPAGPPAESRRRKRGPRMGRDPDGRVSDVHHPGITDGYGSVLGSAERNSGEINKIDFMTLLVAQIQNQDPMSPMDNAEFTGQITQFTMLEELEGVNERLDQSHC